jgi:hypothetical protein
MFAAQIDNAIENLLWNTRETGGDTQSARGDKVPVTGFMVGGVVDALIFDAMLIRDPGHFREAYNGIVTWISQNFKRATEEGMFIGAWIDRETDVAYVDLSLHYENRAEAIHDAKALGELAIWDLGASEEIRVAE